MPDNLLLTFLVARVVKRLSTMREARVQSLIREDPRRRKWQSTLVLLPGKSHGQRSLVGYSPWGRKESDTTEQLHFTSVQSSTRGCPCGASGKESACQSRRCKRHKLNPWIGKIPRAGNGNPLQYPCLENPTDRSIRQGIVHGATKGQT